MIKSKNRLSKEATALFSEHSAITDSIASKGEHIKTANKGLEWMAQAALARVSREDTSKMDITTHEDVIELDIGLMEMDISRLKAADEANQSRAAAHFARNPALVDMAIKEAKMDGVLVKRS